MRQVTLAAATLATLAFASGAYADSNYGPRKNGDQCWHHQLGNSLGYWAPCQPSHSARAVSTRTPATANNATPKVDRVDRMSSQLGAQVSAGPFM